MLEHYDDTEEDRKILADALRTLEGLFDQIVKEPWVQTENLDSVKALQILADASCYLLSDESEQNLGGEDAAE